MAPWPIPKVRPLRAPQGVHLTLAVGVPSAFCTLVVFWLTGEGPGGEMVGAWVYAVVLALWSPWRLRTHQGPLIKLWVWAVVTLLLYGNMALVEGLPWPQTFGPGGQHLVWWLVGLVQGQLAALWAGQLASRARLFQLIEGVPEGRALEDRVREFQLDADFSAGNCRTLMASLWVFGALALVAATLVPTTGGNLLLGGFLGVCLLVGVLLRGYRREMEALMYGRRLSWGDKAAPLGWSALLAVVAGVGAWGAIQVGPWFDWSLLQNSTPPPPPEASAVLKPPPRAGEASGVSPLAVLVALLVLIFRVPFLLWAVQGVLHLAAALVPWALVAFLVWPLVKWFLSGGRETKGLLRRWWRLLVAQVLAFWSGLRSLRPPATGTTPVGSAREWVRSLLRRSALGRKPYPEVVRAFLRLVDWAQPLVAYRAGETTREYLQRVSAQIPDRAQALGRVGDLLDSELFGRTGLGVAERRAFLALVAELTSSPPSREGPPGVS